MAGLYLHIPFCQKRCIYCDFYSTTWESWKPAYVDALCQEMRQRKDYLRGEPIRTIYFGGGTPSQLSFEQLQQLFDTIYQVFTVENQAEITLEANPDDLRPDYIGQLRCLPINRLSMGIQSFQDEKLQQLNRRHTAQQAIQAVHDCQQAGFDNLSIDLIYGLPGHTLQEWQDDLQQAMQLHVQHLSAYHLMYEEGTPLWKLWEEHQVYQVDEDLSVQFFEMLCNTLHAQGFEQYEISNFALPGYHSRHNSSYWQGTPYLGCGASAHSFDGSSRQWNVADLKTYVTGIQQQQPAFEREELTLSTLYNEYVMTGLRTAKGISTHVIRQRFGQSYLHYLQQQAQPHLQAGNLVQQGEDGIKLSHQGIFVSDGIMSDLMFVED